jgi:hypothetical protein
VYRIVPGLPTPHTPQGDLEQRISVERLRPYRMAVGSDLEHAIRLYEWNTCVSGAFYEVLGHLEVGLRNGLHNELTAWHAAEGRAGCWFDDPGGFLDPRRQDEIAAAKFYIAQEGMTQSPGRIVAKLSFGFWRHLLDKRYQPTLWAKALRHAFPYLIPQRRLDIYDPLHRLTSLRNRIAHHEPIHAQGLAAHHDDVLLLAG